MPAVVPGRSGRSLCLGLVLGLTLGLLGCGRSADPVPADPYAADFERVIQDAKSDFVRSILMDHKITVMELSDAHARTLECMRAAGINAAVDTDPYTGLEYLSVTVAGVQSSASVAAEDSCRNEWLDDIDGLYRRVTTNPNNEDFSSLVAACFVRKGLAPKGYSGKDWDELEAATGLSPDLSTMSPDANGRISYTLTEELKPQILPGGADARSPEAEKYKFAPLQQN